MEASNTSLEDVQSQVAELDDRVAALETELVGLQGAKQPPQLDTSTVPDEGPPTQPGTSLATPGSPQPGVGSGGAVPSEPSPLAPASPESSPSAPDEPASDQPAPGVPPQG